MHVQGNYVSANYRLSRLAAIPRAIEQCINMTGAPKGNVRRSF